MNVTKMFANSEVFDLIVSTIFIILFFRSISKWFEDFPESRFHLSLCAVVC